jgi:hypothetical protein
MKVTLIGLNQYLHNINEDLFKNMELPEGIDKDTLTGNILLKGSDFEVMYADPVFMQTAIGLWSKKWYRTFTKWVTALSLEYNPLENYDRKEDWTDTGTKGVTTSGSRDHENTTTFDNEDKRTLDTEDKTTYDTNTTTEKTVSAYDSSTYQPSEKTSTDVTGDDTTTHSGTDTMDHSGTITDNFEEGTTSSEDENTNTVHDGRIHGNVGITTSQQMLEAELQIAEWNLYEHITDLFLSEFVIPIYS